jgi:hypothetical protein
MKGNLRAVRLAAIVVMVGATCGCPRLQVFGQWDSHPEGKGTDDLPNGHLTNMYVTSFEFDRDLTVAVDNILAQVAASDRDVIDEASRYFDVGLNVLRQEPGIVFDTPPVSAISAERTIKFETMMSPWSRSDDWPHSSIANLVSRQTPGSKLRWRGIIPNGSLKFNSFAPKRIDVSAELELEIQESASNGEWVPVPIIPGAISAFQSNLGESISAAYQSYLKERFGVIGAPQFKGTK